MPQTFVAVQCAFCHAFQGTLDKKNKKFNCAVCGQKQSFRHVHAVSNSGKDIRLVVQQLNELRGAHEQAAGNVDQTKVSLPEHLTGGQQQQTVEWEDFAERASEQEPGGDFEEAGPYVTALPEAAGASRGRLAAQPRSKRQKVEQEGADGPTSWPQQPAMPSSKVVQPLQQRPPRPPLQQRRQQQQFNQGVDHRQQQGQQSAVLPSWRHNLSKPGSQHQQPQIIAPQQAPQQYWQQHTIKQGQQRQVAWDIATAPAGSQQDRMPLQQQQASARSASSAGAPQPGQQLPGGLGPADQPRPWCREQSANQQSQQQQQQQQQRGCTGHQQHGIAGWQQQHSWQHSPATAGRPARPPLPQQQQQHHMKPPLGRPAKGRKQAQQQKPAAAAWNSPWGNFVDEDVAAACSDSDSGDVDEQGFCSAVPTYAAGACQHAEGVMLSKWA